MFYFGVLSLLGHGFFAFLDLLWDLYWHYQFLFVCWLTIIAIQSTCGIMPEDLWSKDTKFVGPLIDAQPNIPSSNSEFSVEIIITQVMTMCHLKKPNEKKGELLITGIYSLKDV